MRTTKTTFNPTDKLPDLSKSIHLQGMAYSKLHFGSLVLVNDDNMNYTDITILFSQVMLREKAGFAKGSII